MKKIIIKTDRPQPDSFLVSWLRELFPKCEIDVVPSEGSADSPGGVSGRAEGPDKSANRDQAGR